MGRPSVGNGLCWDPIRPLTGLGDWLDRVAWKGDVEPARARSARVAQALMVSLEQGWRRLLKNTYWDRPARRLEMVEDLLKVVPASSANGSLHDPALRALLESERKQLKPLVEGSLSSAEMREAFKGMKPRFIPISERESNDSWRPATWFWPTIWVSERLPRRSPAAISSSERAAFAAA